MIAVHMTKKGFTEFLEDQATRLALKEFEKQALDPFIVKEYVEDTDYKVNLYIEMSDLYGKYLDDPEDESIPFSQAASDGVDRAIVLFKARDQFPPKEEQIFW